MPWADEEELPLMAYSPIEQGRLLDALMLVVLADVFLTVLYARMGTAILSERLCRALWLAFRGATKGTRL